MQPQNKQQKQWDVIALGEAVLHLEPASQRTLQQAQQLDLIVGGSESNTLAGLVGLGKSACWLSRLPDNDIGQLVAARLYSHGLDTRHICWAPAKERVGLYYVNPGAPPLTSRTIYDRQHSAITHMISKDLDLSLFQPEQARLFHTTGITLALSQPLYETAEQAWQSAENAGWARSFDFNFRANLWSIEEAWRACLPFMSSADLVFISLRDVQLMLRIPDLEATACVEQLRSLLPHPLIIMTTGAEGALAYTQMGMVYHEASRVVSQQGRIGRGDAFSAGFLSAWLDNKDDIGQALLQAALCAAHKSATWGDMPLFRSQDIEQMRRQPQGGLQR